ncbi:MAG: efflux RND transporter permease subunit [Panacagrimonas sp.]
MLTSIIHLCLRHAGVVAVAAALALVAGVETLRNATFDVFPEFVPAVFTVQTEAPGLSAEQVETLVTHPLESVLNGANGVVRITSESLQGLSVVRVSFGAGDALRQRQTVSEQLAGAASFLPPGVGVPNVSPLTSSTMDLLKVGFVSDSLSPMELRDFVQWTVRPQLLGVPGVARAALYGGEVRELQVIVDPQTLVAHDLTLADFASAVESVAGAPGLGYRETATQRLVLQAAATATSAADLRQALVRAAPGQPLRIGDVARVMSGAAPAFSDAVIMDRPGVLISMASQYGANTLAVTLAVEATLEELRPAIDAAGVTMIPALQRPANFITTAFGHLQGALLLGAGLSFALLIFALREWRTAVISFISIPLSLLAAVAVLQIVGVSLNTMTIGGLAVAVGVVVDDGVIDVENIGRRLRERAPDASVFDTIFAASLEVRTPVVYATLVVLLVFVPMLMLDGIQGAFFGPLALSFMLAVAASLLVAMTVTPALCLLLLRNKAPPPEMRVLDWLKRWQERSLAPLHRHIAPVMAGVLLASLLAAFAMTRFGRELLPDFNEGHIVAQLAAPSDAGFPAMREWGTRMLRELREIPQVKTVEVQLGRAEAAEDTWGANRAEFHVALHPTTAEEEAGLRAQVRDILTSTPGISGEVTTFLGERISESITGVTAAVVVTLFGPDLDDLDRAALQLAGILETLPDAADVRVRVPVRAPTLMVRPDPARLALHGIRAGEVYQALQVAHQGLSVAQIFSGDRVTPVSLRLQAISGITPEALGRLRLRGASGVTVELAQVASIAIEEQHSIIEHEGALRRQLVTANPSTRDIAGFVREAKRAVAEAASLPAGVSLRFTGAAEAQAAAARDLAWRSGAIGVVIVMVLAISFGDLRRTALVLLSAPLALIGGVIAVALTGGILSIGSLVGFVTLFGIAARNGIMLLWHYDHLVKVENLPWNFETAQRGARERLTPVLLTAALTALALLPIAIQAGEAGQEIEGPMAIVIVGGLVSSTLLGLVLLPPLALRVLRQPGSGPPTNRATRDLKDHRRRSSG